AASGGVRDDSHAKRFEADERELVGDRRQLGVTVGGAATEGRHEVVAVVPGSGQLRLDSQAALRVAAGPVGGIADAEGRGARTAHERPVRVASTPAPPGQGEPFAVTPRAADRPPYGR